MVFLLNSGNRGSISIVDYALIYDVDYDLLSDTIEKEAFRRYSLPIRDPEHITRKNIEIFYGISHTSWDRLWKRHQDEKPLHPHSDMVSNISKKEYMESFPAFRYV